MGGRDAALEQEVLHLDQHIRHEPYCSIMFGVKKSSALGDNKKKKKWYNDSFLVAGFAHFSVSGDQQ